MGGGGLVGWRLLLACTLLVVPVGLAMAQQPRAAPPRTGRPTLQPEPGDIWAEVRSWDMESRRRTGHGAAPASSQDEAPSAAPRRPAARPKAAAGRH